MTTPTAEERAEITRIAEAGDRVAMQFFRPEDGGDFLKLSLAISNAIRDAEAAARAEEREACAKYVENLFPRIDGPGWLAQDQRRDLAEHIATAIRALR